MRQAEAPNIHESRAQVRNRAYSTSPLIFQASRNTENSPRVLYTSNTAGTEQREDFNLSYLVHDDNQRVARHHAQLEKAIDKPLALLHQVHSSTVVDLDSYMESFGARTSNETAIKEALEHLATEEADAQVSTRTDIALGVYTADCTPVLFADVEHGVYGSAHAGRKGVQNGIVLRVLEMMQHKGAQIDSTEIWLGPNICGNCYETGDLVAQEFEAANETLLSQTDGVGGVRGASSAAGGSPALPKKADFVTTTRFGGPGVDMRRALLAQFSSAGVRSSQIHDADPSIAEQTEQCVGTQDRAEIPSNAMCTLENPLLFSYREWSLTHKEGSNGRFISVLLP